MRPEDIGGARRKKLRKVDDRGGLGRADETEDSGGGRRDGGGRRRTKESGEGRKTLEKNGGYCRTRKNVIPGWRRPEKDKEAGESYKRLKKDGEG